MSCDDTPSLDTSFHDHEMAIDTQSDRAWYRFIADCERLLGVPNLDGNEASGQECYSLDSALDFWESGKTPAQYAARCRAIGEVRPR